ncbi:hypothetical protein [Streptomyces spectabilis]|uniref:Uncharacterized protein n=1 Tax=Streptomyces spectabilis TaxID=68270 RepID=A0A7W8APG6_STRST|nr:hypothetical protein [Streptomyces spectabilis]MBB5102199.1 hypothetical protein [Streptomyces spectabilis]MCI3907247.1 hypothetical protein [Streptomyces spectabilis]
MDERRVERRRAACAHRLEAWADGVVAGLDAQEDVERSLSHALRGDPSLREETAVRRADALRAAALGLGPAGCAVAAGVSPRMLGNWQEQDPAFAAAMTAAAELAERERERAARAEVAVSGLSPAALRVVLKAIREGSVQSAAAALGGWSEQSFLRLRRKSPEVAALLAAARRARTKKADRRGRPRFERGYRLVRVDEGDMGGDAGARRVNGDGADGGGAPGGPGSTGGTAATSGA